MKCHLAKIQITVEILHYSCLKKLEVLPDSDNDVDNDFHSEKICIQCSIVTLSVIIRMSQ